MGLLLAVEDFREVFRRPRALFAGIGLQLLVVPLIAFAISRVFPLEVGLVAGLALVAAVPGGTLSNLITYLAKGNVALSVSLTAITTVLTLVTTPLVLRALLVSQIPADLAMPVERVARDIALCLLLPLAAGIAIGARVPSRRRNWSRWSIRTSLGIIGVMVVGGAGSGRLDPFQFGWVGPVVIFGFALLCFQAGEAATRLAGLPDRDRLAVGIEVTFRNTNLALLVKASLFPAEAGVVDPIGDGMFYTALVYGGIQIVAVFVPIAVYRRKLRA
jgi:BASS family bile acid:Na+ symporter